MQELWPSSGFRLLRRGDDGRLTVTDDFLRAYFMRPEVAPQPDSCDVERALHAELIEDPRRAIADARISSLSDVDARENYRIVLAFRDRLIAANSVEACYRDLFAGAGSPAPVPPLFVDQLAHVILRNILEDCDDPFRVRAAELFFRKQTAMSRDGAILLGDEETIAMVRRTGGFGSLGKLIAEAGTPLRQVELDVLNRENADGYWARSDRFDMVLDLTFGREGLDALCRVLESWVKHFLDTQVSVQPAQSITDEHWVWHVGLDADATAILNDLYRGVAVNDARRARLISLFRLEFGDPAPVRPQLRGRPVYLALAMAADNNVRLKPQNLLVNLPLTETV
ncbi:MAG: hypothetical protein JSU82_09480 [Rhodospirillales bacterium]|nr:MAG: hypothetical protein JSU82_09480 [Rhodospirillales bacterium]